MRNGDFSALLPGRVIRDPLTGQPFPGNIIPQDRISPQGRALLNAFPLPIPGFQQGANNWIGNPSVFNNQRKDSIKIDWVPTSNHRLAVRHTWAPNVWNDPEPLTRVLDDLGLPGPHDGGDADEHAVQLAHQRVLVLVGLDQPVEVLRAAQLRLLPGRHRRVAVSDDTADVGINYPYLFPGTKLDPDKIPNISLQGFTAINNAAYPGSWNDFVFLWADNVTKITGNHAFKAGVEHRAVGHERSHSAQLRAGAGHDEPERLVPLLRHARRTARGYSAANALLGLFDDYTEFGNKPNTKWLAMAYDCLRAGQLEADPRPDARARPADTRCGSRGARRNRAMASFDPAVLRPGDGAGDRSRRRVRRQRRSLQRHRRCPATLRPTRRSRTSRSWRTCSGCITACRTASPRRPKDGFQPRLGLAYAINDQHDVPGRRRPVPEPRADQHDGGLRLQPAALGDADRHQRHRRRAGRRRRRATSRW